MTDNLARTLDNLNRLLETNAQHISGTLENLDTMTGDLSGLLASERRNLQAAVENLTEFSVMLGENAPRVDSMMGNLNRITTELAEAGFARELSETVAGMTPCWNASTGGEGTVGRLLNDPALYESLERPATTWPRCWPIWNSTRPLCPLPRSSAAAPKRCRRRPNARPRRLPNGPSAIR